MSRATNINVSVENATRSVWKPCWWMQAGVVDYKLCDREYDCERCAFDEVLQGKVTRLSSGSATVLFDSPSDQQSTANKRSDASPASVRGCEVPNGLFYHPGHTWARIEEAGAVRTGIDDFGQRVLGRAYSVSIPLLGSAVRRGEECWRLTHQTGVAALVSPVSGKVREINSSLFQRPSLINRNCSLRRKGAFAIIRVATSTMSMAPPRSAALRFYSFRMCHSTRSAIAPIFRTSRCRT